MKDWLRNRLALWLNLWIQDPEAMFFYQPDPSVPDLKPYKYGPDGYYVVPSGMSLFWVNPR